MERKYLITYNSMEVVTISESNGGTIVTGTNVIITTLDKAVTMLDALEVDTSKILEEIEKVVKTLNGSTI